MSNMQLGWYFLNEDERQMFIAYIREAEEWKHRREEKQSAENQVQFPPTITEKRPLLTYHSSSSRLNKAIF